MPRRQGSGGGGGERHNLAPDALRFVFDATALSVAQLRSCDAWPAHLLAGSTPCDDISGCTERAAQLGMHAVIREVIDVYLHVTQAHITYNMRA